MLLARMNIRENILEASNGEEALEVFEKEKIEAGSAFDFRNLTPIQKRYELGHPEFQYTRAYDTPFLLGLTASLISCRKWKTSGYDY